MFELLVEASSPRFMAGAGKQLVAKLVQHLGGLDCGGLQEAVQKLQSAAALVPGGSKAMQDNLQALQVQWRVLLSQVLDGSWVGTSSRQEIHVPQSGSASGCIMLSPKQYQHGADTASPGDSCQPTVQTLHQQERYGGGGLYHLPACC